MKVNIDKQTQIADGLKVSNIPAVFLIFEGKIVDQFVGLPKPEQMQEFFNKAVILFQISHDPKVQDSLMEKGVELIKSGDLETAFGVLVDMYQYKQMVARFEPELLTAIGYCLVYKHKDFARAHEMFKLITPEKREKLSEWH